MNQVRHLQNEAIPQILQKIPSPPQELFVIGPLEELLKRPRLSVVGTRKPTPYGIQVTKSIVQELAVQGVVIISGLAFGVDSVAHKTCIEARGQTIAVLPTNLEEIYPVSHQRLAQSIIDSGGALVSEYPPGSIAYKTNFVARNRLVSGLSEGILIIEAAHQSGTLHTANFALEQGKDVMVLPGNIISPLSAGTNNLLKEGATPITSSQDIINALGLAKSTAEPLRIMAADAQEAAILDLIYSGTSDSGKLLEQCGMKPSLFNQTLTILEITGKVRALGAGHYGLNQA